MTSGRVGVQIGMVMVSLGMLLIVGGCSGKRVASTAGDQSLVTKGKAEVVSVRPDQVASVQTPSPSGGSSPQDARGSQLAASAPGSGSLSSSSAAPSSKGSALAPDLSGLGDIYFDFDQYNIRKEAQPVLEGDARWLRNQAGKTLLIEGHCDERGTLAYNLVLGEKRAKSAKRYLEDLGIPATRIHTTTYGEVRPFCKEHNEGCWQKNRRDHFVVH